MLEVIGLVVVADVVRGVVVELGERVGLVVLRLEAALVERATVGGLEVSGSPIGVVVLGHASGSRA